ncbi:hypothetical protein FIU97_05835 [Roseivivax sp. THAF40]|uniref:DUF1127 domain-containing protein n=1 Tax=unclassified Roseivivax TaxID=2639302 RepID=UPI0012685D4F|nr:MULTISPECIES: DUF1127 domain-containing protein [unclassified Roseivivax]QFS82300.1 hypothetical protein FIV09_05625 [Roseivivax sp. THAF197b]QFT46091.1 hypothetical protein FIU97_05835 [Roseivivax sp. THAF40]
MSLMDLAFPLPRHRQSLRARFARMVRLHSQRRALGALDAHLLQDIGVSAEDARIEAARPAWDAPDHWQG